MNKRQKGMWGEEVARAHLEGRGFIILEHGFKCRRGEVDLIARKGGEYYFIEVKTRWSSEYGDPLESITPDKQERVIKAAEFYMAKSRLKDAACHLSAIGVDVTCGEPKVVFIEDAFELN